MATAPDFVAAIVAGLQANAACATAFGSTAITPKFQGTQAFRADLPYARILEVSADDVFQSIGPGTIVSYFEHGVIQIDVFADAMTTARSLGVIITGIMNTTQFVFDDGTLLEVRIRHAAFIPEPAPAPGAVIAYHRMLQFAYVIQRQL